MTQTAVEWLIIQMHTHWTNEDVTFQTLLEQAKTMEKEQIIDAVNDSWNMAKHSNFADAQAEQYYNETFKKD
jgi:hypothetical protein